MKWVEPNHYVRGKKEADDNIRGGNQRISSKKSDGRTRLEK